MRTFSTVAIFALALTGANAAVYTGDGAVTQSGVVTVGDPTACPVRLPAQSSLFCVCPFASESVTTRSSALARRAGDRLTSRTRACVRDESSAIHALLCARAARPLTFPPRRLSAASQTEYTSGASSIDVSYTGFPAGETVDIKLCFTDEKIKERPWRKYVNNLEKNKQCWQTADLLKIFKKGAVTTGADGAGSVSVELPVNVAPSEYTIMVYSKDADGAFTQWQDSKENAASCPIKTKIYNNLPTSLVGVQAFFTVFSILVLAGSYTYDRAKQQATL